MHFRSHTLKHEIEFWPFKAAQTRGARVLVSDGAALRRLRRYTSHELADRFGFATALEAIP